jgi:hypothetical protein
MNGRSIALLLALASLGCGKAFVLEVPDFRPDLVPRLFAEKPANPAPLERLDCQFMTVLIDYSRHGDTRIAVEVAEAMAGEFESLGTRVTSRRAEAFWSLMILASRNGRSGYIFSATLSARNMNEGYDPGVTVFRQEEDESAPGKGPENPHKIPTMYHGLSYGPQARVEDQARIFVRQAYAAVYPYAEQLCELEESDRERERSLDEQLPGAPEPL